MKIYNILRRAALISGMSVSFLEENGHDEISERSLTVVNAVLFDLCEMQKSDSLFDETDIDEETADVAVYGVAMFLSLAFGDTEKSEVFSKIYSDRRAKVKSKICEIKDTLPKVGGGI